MHTKEDIVHYIECKFTENYVKYYTNVVSDDLCSKLIRENFAYKPSRYATHDSGARVKDDRVDSKDFWIFKDNTYYQGIKSCYEDVVERYHSDFNLFTAQHLTDFRVSKYETGGFISKHIDTIHHSHGQEWGYPQVTALLFLNDDYEGGDIIIAGKTFHTSVGSALIFPSNFMYPHEVNEITSGTRYSVTCWLM